MRRTLAAAVIAATLGLTGCTSAPPPVSEKVQAAYEEGLKQAAGPQEVQFVTLEEVLPKLRAGEPFTLTVIGDSTGYSTTGWVRPTVEVITAATGKAAVVHDWDATAVGYAAPVTIGDGQPTLTVWNGSASGKNADYAAENAAALMPEKSDLIIINHGHNSGAVFNAMEHLKRLVSAVRTSGNGKDAALVVTAQNPRTDGEAGKVGAEVVAATKETAATYEGVTVLDVHSAFQNSGQPLPSLLVSDGLHPSPAGYEVWSAAVLESLGF